jgi:transcriptional regulator with XRE-family HTH domain
MANENLKNALRDANLTPEQFAEIVKVDPKTVQRWVAGSTTPYRRHRATVARALDLREDQLWPDTASTLSTGAEASSQPDPGSRNELAGTWGYATDDDAPDHVAYIADSHGPIDILHNGQGIDLTNALLTAVIEQAAAGRHVRLLTRLPTSQLEPLIGQPEIEVRVLDDASGYSLFRAGDSMLLTLDLAHEADQRPPLLKLERTAAEGLLDRLVGNFETLWESAEATITDAQQLNAYLTNLDEVGEVSDDGKGQARADPTGPNGSTASRLARADESAALPIPASNQDAQRRWPRRPQ